MSTAVRAYSLIYAGTIATGALAAGSRYGNIPGLTNSGWFCQCTFPVVNNYGTGRVFLFAGGLSMWGNATTTAEGSFRYQTYGRRPNSGGTADDVPGSGRMLGCVAGIDANPYLIGCEDSGIDVVMNYWVWAPVLNY